VLLFDEATAAIDGASDAAFRATLRVSVLARGCGVLTVAHRLSTALEADRIIVLDKGSIVEEEPPAELGARGRRFAALLELEAAGWDWRTGPSCPRSMERLRSSRTRTPRRAGASRSAIVRDDSVRFALSPADAFRAPLCRGEPGQYQS
jgi:ABC-type multidrug transport system ATPase subunit